MDCNHRLVLVTLLVAWFFGFSRGIDLGRLFRPNENNRPMKRRLSEVSETQSNINLINGHDAATGTFIPPELSEHQGMNACDSQMAKSLVALTEQRDKALIELREVKLDLQSTKSTLMTQVSNLEKELNGTREESQSFISKLQLDLSTTRAKMEKEVHNANERADKEITEARSVFEAATEKLQKETNETIQAVYDSSNDNIARIQQERDRRIAEMEGTIKELKSIRQLESEQLMQESELLVASLKAEALKNVSDVQIKAENEISRLTMESAESISQLQLQLSATKADAVAALQNLQEEAFHNASVIMEEANFRIAALEKDRDDKIAALNDLLDATKTKAATDLHKAKKEAEDEIAKVKADADQSLSQAREEHEETVDSLNTKIDAMRKKIAELKAAKKKLKLKHKEAKKSVLSWEKLHSERSYCNLTHVHEDTSAALLQLSRRALHMSRRAADQAAVHLDIASKHVARVAGDVTQKASVAAAPHIQKSRELYDQHLKQHVDKLREHHETHVLPLHNKYIVPTIPIVAQYATKARNSLELLSNSIFVSLVSGFKASCPLAMKKLRSFEQRSKYFVGLSEPVSQGCSNPEETVLSVLALLVVIFIVIFRVTIWIEVRRLLLLVKGILLIPVRIIWFFCPLRFFIGKKSKKKETKDERKANGAVRGNKSKKNKKE